MLASACPSSAQLQVRAQLVFEPVLTWEDLRSGPNFYPLRGVDLILQSQSWRRVLRRLRMALVNEMPGVGRDSYVSLMWWQTWRARLWLFHHPALREFA